MEEIEKNKAEKELLLKFSRSRRITRSSPRTKNIGKREKLEKNREDKEKETTKAGEDSALIVVRTTRDTCEGSKAEIKAGERKIEKESRVQEVETEQMKAPQNMNEQLALVLQEIKLVRDERTKTRARQDEIKKELKEWKEEMKSELQKMNAKYESKGTEVKGIKRK